MKFLSIFLLAAAVIAAPISAWAQSGANLPAQTQDIHLCGTTPVNGTNEVQTFTMSTGTSPNLITFAFKGDRGRLALTGTETNSVITTLATAAIGGMSTVGTSNISIVTTGTSSRAIAVTFTNNFGKLDVPQITLSGTNGSVTLAGSMTTPGVTADGRNLPKNAMVIDKANSALYINSSGTAFNPSWVKVGPP